MLANSPAASQSAPQGAPPQPVAPHPHQRPSRRKWWLLSVAILLASGAAWALRPKPAARQQAAHVASVRTVKAATATLQRRSRISGTTSARNFANIAAPMMRGPDAGRSLVLIALAKSGRMVKKGEMVAQIDAQAIKDHVDDVEAMVQSAEADVRKRKAEHAIEMENVLQNLRVAKANYDKTRLDAKAAEVRTTIDQELLKLAAEEADAQYKQLQQDLTTVQQRQKAEVRLLEIVRERQERHRDRHKTDLLRFTINAPMPGLVVMQSLTRGGDTAQIQLGDQVSPGQPFMKIVDTSSMQLDAYVNQAEAESIRLAQTGIIEFDAFPGLTLQGKVVAVGALAIGGWRQNYYIRNIPIRLAIEGNDSRVIPDLSASADVLLAEQDDAVVIPRAALSDKNGKTVVYVKTAEAFAAREVEIGELNNTQVAVVSGLKAGEEIAQYASAVLNR